MKMPIEAPKAQLPELGALPMDVVMNFAVHKYWGVSDPVRFKALLDAAW